jgi:glucose-6-phosphate dehydrogenase assembly protein OpcA
VLLFDEHAKVGMAELAAATRCHGSTHDIVLEEIAIRLPEAAFAQIPGLVRPLLMNDLPNHLFWATRWPTNAATFDALAGLCDHVVVDSRRFADPERDLRAVQERRARGVRITDLTWLRLRPWRRAFAEAFERVPWTAGTPATGTVRHGRAAAAAAHRLAAWVRERLGAKIELDASGDAAAPGPDSVVVRTGGFEVELEAVPPHVRIHVTTPEHCWLPFSVPLSRGTDGDLLGAAIDMG